MGGTLPSNLHAELALDRGRLSREGPERSMSPSFTAAHAAAMDQHARVQSFHGVVVENARFAPDEKHGVIAEEPASGTLSGAELAAVLDQEDDGDDDDEVIRPRQPQRQVGESPRSLSPRTASLNNSASLKPNGILQNRNETFSPPPRSSSCSVPASTPQLQRQQAFPDRPRFQLTDDGPICPPPTPEGYGSGQGQGSQPAVRRAVSDSHPHTHSAPNSQGLGVTPPMRRGTAQTQPSTPTKYATFEEMGIQAKGAESDNKECVIM